VKCQIIGDNIDAATLDATISILPKWGFIPRRSLRERSEGARKVTWKKELRMTIFFEGTTILFL
jgi:hypothetical protein